MNVAKTAIYLVPLLLVTVMPPAQSWGQSGAPGTRLRSVVPRDTETMVNSASKYRVQEGSGQCSPNGIPALEVVTPPEHGTVRFVTTDVGIPRGSGCSNSIFTAQIQGSSAGIDLPTTFRMSRRRSSALGRPRAVDRDRYCARPALTCEVAAVDRQSD